MISHSLYSIDKTCIFIFFPSDPCHDVLFAFSMDVLSSF